MIASAFKQQRQRIGPDRQPGRRTAGQRTRILAEPGRVFAFERAGEAQPVGFVDRPHDHPAHAARRSATTMRNSAMPLRAPYVLRPVRRLRPAPFPCPPRRRAAPARPGTRPSDSRPAPRRSCQTRARRCALAHALERFMASAARQRPAAMRRDRLGRCGGIARIGFGIVDVDPRDRHSLWALTRLPFDRWAENSRLRRAIKARRRRSPRRSPRAASRGSGAVVIGRPTTR